MRKISLIFAAMLLSCSIGYAQMLWTQFAAVGATFPGGNPNVGIGINNPNWQLHVVAPAGANGINFDADNYQYGTGNSVPPGNSYSGASGQSNNIMNGSTESFAFGLNNTLDQAHHSFIAGFQNQIMNTVGPNSCMILGGHSTIEKSHESVTLGEDNHIRDGHGSIAMGGHNYNDGHYTISIGQGLNNNMPQTIWAGFGGVPTFFLGNNRVGIGTTNPQTLLHVADTIRSDALIGGGNVCADANGNLIISGPCAGPGPGISSTCGIINRVPKTIDALGNLACSQIFDNGGSVGINTTGPFGYTWAGGLTGPVLPPGAGTVRLDVNGVTRALAYIATSDARMKANVQPITEARSTIQRLTGKTYQWTPEVIELTGADNARQYGFIAQEVAEVLPEAVSVDEEGKYGVNYNYIIPVLTEAVKEQQAELDSKSEEINNLKSQMNTLMNELAAMRSEMNLIQGTPNGEAGSVNGSSLMQNEPNPFSNSTVIRFNLASNVQKASVYIYNLRGKQEAKYDAQPGKNEVTVLQGSLEPGIYIYTLVTDGRVVDTKRMIIED